MSRISKKGQVVIPKEIREALGIKTGVLVFFRVESGKVLIDVTKQKMKDILKSSKPLDEKSVEFQRKLREEWD
ncbi:MAG: AbrB/MazE/SpoVT family DNA-binding domain-containing protein [Archaeoglobaceae archaeon]